jgi:hypothetical protein
MTKKNLIYLWVFAFGFALVSCDKDKDKESDSGVSVNTISAKWEISDSKSPYASFEFNKDGNYIVVENVGMNSKNLSKNSTVSLFENNSSKATITRSSESNLSPIHFGTYKIEGNKIILSGFGLIEVISITAEEFSFSFTLEATGQKNSFVAGKSDEPISSSSRTDMFCRTWVVEKMTINGELDDDIIGTVVLFSKAGTYLVLYDGEEGEAGLAEWKWANTAETKFYYSWDNWEYDWEDNVVTINQLSNNILIIQENFGEGDWVYHLTLKK